ETDGPRRGRRLAGTPPPQATAARPDDADAARPAARLARGLLRRADRDRRGVQLRRLLAEPRAARLHAGRVAGLRPQLRLPRALLEVREDVADGVGDHRPPRLPPRVLPRPLRHEAQVRPPAPADRPVPDELPAARPGLEGDSRQPGRGQLVPLLDRPPVSGPPALPAALQQVRRDAGARLHLAPV